MTCPTCERPAAELVMERHHLKTRRKDRDATEKLCRECHKTVHGLFTQRELRDERLGLDTVDGLLACEKFWRAVEHIKKVSPGAHLKVREARTRRGRR